MQVSTLKLVDGKGQFCENALKVFLNGEEVKGLRYIKFERGTGQVGTVTIEAWCKIDTVEPDS